jgi:predicted RND superfamily exporter protein
MIDPPTDPDWQDLDPIGWINERICERPERVILVFLLLTAGFATGLPAVTVEAGTSQFAEDVPAQEAQEAIDQRFGIHFAPDTASTSLIQRGGNVLSKPNLLRLLRAQRRLSERESQRVRETNSAARTVARTLDPNATTLSAQIDALERSTPREIDAAVARAAAIPGFSRGVSTDFNARSATASASIATVTHAVPGGTSSGAGASAGSSLTPIQLEAQRIVETTGGDIRVFGSGILSAEFGRVIGDSLRIVVPGAVFFIVTFLVLAYRDLLDLALGVIALGVGLVWTFGFMGLAGVPFSQILIAVPPLLLAVGIDFGIHTINRYREERERGTAVSRSMRLTTRQLLVAFFIVTTTTVIGFASNLTSTLLPVRDFGAVASVGILFTFAIFGIFLPACKVAADRYRDSIPIPVFSQQPLGSSGSVVGRALSGGVIVAKRAPAVLVVLALLASAGAGAYATGMDTTFSNEDFLPPEEQPWYIQAVPEPFAPSEYRVVDLLNFLQENFETSEQDSVTVFLEAPMERSSVLESIHRAGRDPPETVLTDGRQAQSRGLIDVIQSQAEQDPAFARLVARNDRDGNGIPDRNLGRVYDALLATPAHDQAREYLTTHRRSTRVVYSVEADASDDAVTADARELADRQRYPATATGDIVVFQAISTIILESAVQSLVVALIGTAIFLVFIYRLLEGYATLGVANLVPIVVTVTMLAGTMHALGMSFNAFSGTILAITIGIGIDYSVHVTHRFADERRETDRDTALERTVVGTGGALAGSMFTTVFGIGVLVLAVFPAIGQFGVLTALSVFYAFLASLLVLPSTLALWDRLVFERHRSIGVDRDGPLDPPTRTDPPI